MMQKDNIRNFVIIAHIDHGKSTLADRMIEITGTVAADKIKPQMLDMMDLEREKGITIKLQPVTMKYPFKEDVYVLNLIDTPGHVDFSYEVSRSLKAVEGAVLLVDASQGIQAQTLANLHIAQEHNLKIIPVINKIDLPGAKIDETRGELAKLLNIDHSKIFTCSAKTGEGVKELLREIIEYVPHPKGQEEGEFKALIFDSIYDSYKGVIAYVKVFEGILKEGSKIKLIATKKETEATEVGEFKLEYLSKETLRAGEIGYIVTGAKSINEIRVGDTIVNDSPSDISPIADFKIPIKTVFASIYSTSGDVNRLKIALEKLLLNDSSLSFEPENSTAFGQGFRCGFLGLLHLEIVKERLEREYNLDLIVAKASVLYKEEHKGSKVEYQEPWAALEIVTPQNYLGPIMELAQSKRAIYKNTRYIANRVVLEYDIPLSEIIIDFYDKLKSISSGYASQNYELIGWRKGDLVLLEVMIAGEKIKEFDRIVIKNKAQQEARVLAKKLKDLIPRQMFEVAIQVTIGGKVIARENISAFKKDVTAKLYGGDRTRKDKLLKKQTKGKKKMKKLGRVDIPSNVFIDILKE